MLYDILSSTYCNVTVVSRRGGRRTIQKSRRFSPSRGRTCLRSTSTHWPLYGTWSPSCDRVETSALSDSPLSARDSTSPETRFVAPIRSNTLDTWPLTPPSLHYSTERIVPHTIFLQWPTHLDVVTVVCDLERNGNDLTELFMRIINW